MCLYQLILSGTKILCTDTLSGNIDYLIILMFQNMVPSALHMSHKVGGHRPHEFSNTECKARNEESFVSEVRAQ